MNKINIFSYAVAEYRIQNIGVEIYYAPAVLDAYFSKAETIKLLESNSKKPETFDRIFNIIKSQVEKFQTYEMWYDLIEYKGIELVWKSRFYEEKKMMYIEVLYSQYNERKRATTH